MTICVVAHAGTNEMYHDSLTWTGRVFIDIIGDSLPGGGGGQGGGATAVPVAISNAAFGHFFVANHAVGGTKWSDAPGQSALALTNGPRWLFIDMGRNDCINHPECFTNGLQFFPCAQAQIEFSLMTVMTNCRNANCGILLGEILPAYSPTNTEFSVVGIQACNAWYFTWCHTNPYSYNTRFISEHDAFGQLNITNGIYAWMQQQYWQTNPLDQLHINTNGDAMWGPLIVSNLLNYYPTVTANQTNLSAVTNTTLTADMSSTSLFIPLTNSFHLASGALLANADSFSSNSTIAKSFTGYWSTLDALGDIVPSVNVSFLWTNAGPGYNSAISLNVGTLHL